jgi:trehalose/maltose hydrolase-like predicted phosphorylase
MAIYDAQEDLYDIDSVMGPDEFHDGAPGQPGSGVQNNAYTNILLAWILRLTATLLSQLNRDDDGKTNRRQSIRADELDRWDRCPNGSESPSTPTG